MTSVTKKKVSPLLKFLLELGPLVLFFIANSKPALFSWLVAPVVPAGLPAEKVAVLTSTAVLMVSVVAALIASLALTRRWPIMPVVTAVAVLIFGGLTFLFQDKLFIQLKPTIVNGMFGAILLIGLAFNKLLLPAALDSVLHLDEEGWRKLSLRWGVFFFFLAGLNEAVRLTQSWDVWTGFKIGLMPLTLIFALAQTPLIMQHEVKAEDEKEHF
jgi:intracellular septation protein